jgi:uncharacterized membrane protein YraQ (UPF0718 family)
MGVVRDLVAALNLRVASGVVDTEVLRKRSLPTLLGALGGCAVVLALAAIVRFNAGRHSARLEEFELVFVSIVVEALPFIILGALVSSLIAVFVPDHAFRRVSRMPTHVQVPGAMACAMAFPVCECGSVPVARRLIRRGVAPAAGLAFMLAAPVVNPVVLVSTYVAYQSTGLGVQMTVARFGLGLIVAAVAALLLRRAASSQREGAEDASDHAHDHGHAGGLSAVADHVAADFVYMGKFLVVGAAVAAAMQTFVPRSLFDSLGGSILLAPIVMMALAFLLSLCSEADAFVAVSFTGFGTGSQLAFLALGPVLDAKLALLYWGTFKRWFVPALLAVAAPIILVGSLCFEVAVR